MAGQGPHAYIQWSKAANKETRIKTQFSPTESICAGRTESGTPRGYET